MTSNACRGILFGVFYEASDWREGKDLRHVEEMGASYGLSNGSDFNPLKGNFGQAGARNQLPIANNIIFAKAVLQKPEGLSRPIIVVQPARRTLRAIGCLRIFPEHAHSGTG